MRFLVDECTGTRVANWLQSQEYQVFSVYDRARGINDGKILALQRLLSIDLSGNKRK